MITQNRTSRKRALFHALAAVLAAAASLCASVLFSCAKTDDAPQDDARYKTVIASRDTIGNGGYGSVFNAQIDPFDENYFAALCDMGGIYFSYDCGENWTRHNIKGTLYALEYDQTTDGVVWFGGSGLYKSCDHGKTFESVFPKASQITSAGNNFENINYWLYTDGQSDYAPHYQIHSIAINRKSGGTEVYCAQRIPDSGMGYSKCVRVYRTTDGENFSLFTELPYSFNFAIEYDESNDCLIYVTPNYISEIDRSGDIACTIDQPVKLQFANGNKLSFDSYYDAASDKNTFVFSAPSDGEHVSGACFKTNDLRDKSSYVDLTEELASLTVNDLGIENIAEYNRNLQSYEYCEWIDGKPIKRRFKWTINNVRVFNDSIVYLFHEAATPIYKPDGTLYLNRRTSIYLKYDGSKPAGERFTWIYGFPMKPYDTTIVNAARQDGDVQYSLGMCADGKNENALLFCNNIGLYYTDDSKTVRQLNNKILGNDELRLSDGTNAQTISMQRVDTTGVDVVCSQTVATDPFDDDHVLMGCTDIGLLQSYDNAESWYRALYEWDDGAAKDIKYAAYTNTCYDIHFDKERRGVVYALWSQIQNAPYSAAENYLGAQGRFGVSYDGGLSWTMKKITADGRCLPYRMQVVYDGDSRKIYIADEGRGFFVTDDLGETFSTMNNGIQPCAIGGKTAVWGNDILVCKSGIFAVTGGISSDPDAGHGFYKWNDDTREFKNIALPAVAVNGSDHLPAAVRDIEYDEKNDCIYLACITDKVTNYKSMIKTAGGILKYKNGRFTQIYNDRISVFAVNIDRSGRLYATEANGAVARFNDDNSAYEILIDGLFHSLKKVCFGKTDDILYIPTWGGNTERIALEKVRA